MSRVERGGGGIAKPLHVYLCFVFCVVRMGNQGAYRNLFPFPGYQHTIHNIPRTPHSPLMISHTPNMHAHINNTRTVFWHTLYTDDTFSVRALITFPRVDSDKLICAPS